ncbi:hypothetical protein DM56_4278 [Burkholderia mallei]|nr:hypothetical protein DM75_2771 [Burkholderia mallei]KGR97860.1 hypothetical protein X977_5328 [Burkholderia pseudomallei MSHR7504]KOS77131.1 hypothetical protein DM46_2569 [Burkholderia mallei]KOT01898.1 hypothetical protein DM50_2904 [Burkholderia mallei]KOT08426.1 hypothetical protein DM77_2268 [Burkholderia mallei]
MCGASTVSPAFLGSCVRMRAGREPIAPALHVNRSETGDAPGIAMMQRNAAAGQPAMWDASCVSRGGNTRRARHRQALCQAGETLPDPSHVARRKERCLPTRRSHIDAGE